MSTVSTAFGKAAAEDRAALVGYLPAGYPDKQTAIRAALAMAEAGADVIEVGLPYSDPLMDGPDPGAALERVVDRVRDHRAVHQRVGVGQPDLDHVRARLGHRQRGADRGLLVGEAGRKVADQRGPVFCPRLLERGAHGAHNGDPHTPK